MATTGLELTLRAQAYPGIKYDVVSGIVSAQDDDTIETDLASIKSVQLTTEDGTHIAAVKAASISGGNFDLALKTNAGAAVSSDENIHVKVEGQVYA